MVGIVVVSHSALAAAGICEMSRQMAGRDQQILAAGGLEDGSLGTDAMRIADAIRIADSGDGVLVTVDLGSALLSAETALEFLDEPLRSRVKIADGPVLEGTVVAAVQAMIGDSLESVLAAAEGARELRKKE